MTPQTNTQPRGCPRARAGLGLVLGVSVGIAGCGPLQRVHECQAVIETINSGLAELHVQVPDAGSSAPAYEDIAAVYEALGKRLDELAPADATLAKALAGYRDVTERAATHSRAYSVELTTVARSKLDRTSKEARLNRIRTLAKSDVSREATAVRKLNALCHPQ